MPCARMAIRIDDFWLETLNDISMWMATPGHLLNLYCRCDAGWPELGKILRCYLNRFARFQKDLNKPLDFR
jgi:hypothetical protein